MTYKYEIKHHHPINIQHVVKFQVALNGLETNLAECKLGSIMAEIGSTKSEKQQKHTCYEEEDKLTTRAESELQSASVRFVLFYRNSA